MINKREPAEGIRFAGRRSAAPLENVREWDYQLSHNWTTAGAFRHVAAAAGRLQGFYPLLDGGVLSNMGVQAIAEGNAKTIETMKDKSRDELKQMILAGHEASARLAETLDPADLATVVTLGGCSMKKAERESPISGSTAPSPAPANPSPAGQSSEQMRRGVRASRARSCQGARRHRLVTRLSRPVSSSAKARRSMTQPALRCAKRQTRRKPATQSHGSSPQ